MCYVFNYYNLKIIPHKYIFFQIEQEMSGPDPFAVSLKIWQHKTTYF